ncbi:helix-turn-helix domain-containing protein [Bacillus paranthracis]
MMINKSYKFRIYPHQAQAILINKTIEFVIRQSK